MIRCISHSGIVKLKVLHLRLSSGIMGLVCGISGPEEGVVHDYQVLHMNSWPCGPLNSEHERGGISTPSQLDSFHFPATFMIGQWEEHNVEMGRYYIKQRTNVAQRIPTDGHHVFFFFVIRFDLWSYTNLYLGMLAHLLLHVRCEFLDRLSIIVLHMCCLKAGQLMTIAAKAYSQNPRDLK